MYFQIVQIMKLKALLFLILHLLVQTTAFEFGPLEILSVTTKIINTAATYTLFYDRTVDATGSPTIYSTSRLSSTQTITLTFPVEFSNSAFSSITCKASINGGTSITHPCSLIQNLKQIVITGVFSDNQIVSNATVVINNVINPSPALTTQAFKGTIGNDNSNVYYGDYVTLLAGQFDSCSITFSPAVVNSTSSMILTIDPKNEIPTTGSIQVDFTNSQWANDVSATHLLPIQTSMACTNYSSNINSAIACSGSLSLRRITATNIFYAASTASFQLGILNFLSPPTTNAADTVSITSYEGGYKIDTCVASISGLTARTISSLTITDANGNSLTVNKVYTLKFTFRLMDTLSGSDYFAITFPSNSVFTFDSATVTGTPALVKTSATYNPLTRIATLYMSDASKIYLSGTYVTISLGNYTAPTSVLTTGGFTITIYRLANKITMTGSVPIVAKSSLLSGSVSVLNTTINANTTYQFTITISDPISSSGKINIQFPSSMNILTTSSSCAISVGTSLKATPTCTVVSSTNSISLTDINSSSSVIPAQTFSVSIQGIKNPESAVLSSGFTVSTYYSTTDETLTSQGTVPGFTPTPAKIYQAQVRITPSEYIVNESPISYSFQVKIQHPIPVGGSVIIYVPVEVDLDESIVFGHCQINTDGISYRATACAGQVFNSTYSKITFSNPFIERLESGAVFIARVKSVFTNPSSTAPTPTFGISTFYSGGTLLAKIEHNITVAMTSAAAFSSLEISRLSNKNQQLTEYQFIIRQLSPFSASSLLFITFPSQVIPSSGSVCQIKSPISSQLTCSYDLVSKMTITLPSSIISSDVSITISISLVKNPPSFKPVSGQFIFQSKTPLSIGNYLYSYSTLVPSYLVNTVATSFSELLYEFTPEQLGEAIQLDITFKSTPSSIVTLGSIRITVPNLFIISSLQCSSPVNIENIVCNGISANSIEISGNFLQSQLMKITISGFQSPITLSGTTEYSSLVSFDTGGFKIAESVNKISFTLGCTLPCKDCTLISTQCLQCYSDTQITLLNYYDSALKKCFQQCPLDKYETLSLTCDLCSNNCQTCEGTADFCTSCKTTNTFLYLYLKSDTQHICVEACPDQLYPQLGVSPITCVACISPCLTCTDSSTCLSCVSGTYYLNNECSEVCPDSYYIENSLTNECDPCDANCVTCTGEIAKCTSCKEDELLYLDQCITECPTGLVPQENTCGDCDLSCLTCVQNPFKCTSCQPGSSLPYFYESQNSCLGSCPDQYYEDIDKCSLCSDLTDRHCSNCESEIICLSCDGNYVLYQSNCVLTLPEGYINISGIAVPCTGDCKTCSITQANCTACQTLFLLQNQCIASCPIKYIGIDNICQSCVSPCKTCETQTIKCTSCLTTLNPEVYLSGNQCLEVCPGLTYPSNTTNQCEPCNSPCQKCISESSCLTCLAPYFFSEGSCLTTCPPGYLGVVGVNRQCKICLGNCATCLQTQTNCLSCKEGTYFLNNQCLSDCGTGYFKSAINSTCELCPTNCLTCLNTASCLTCKTGSLYNGVCLTVCPSKFYSSNKICFSCPENCSSCISDHQCTGCTENLLLYQSNCISSCPLTHSVVINQTCTKCTTSGCHQCNSGDYCLSCTSGNSLLLGVCYSECPVRYETNGTHCLETNQIILTSDSSFPVPFSIATAVVFIACLMSKLQFNHTFMAGAVFSLLGVIEWGALIYYLYLYNLQMVETSIFPLYLGLAALGVLYLLNILALIIQNAIFCKDKQFNNWNKGPNIISTVLCNFGATIISHKFRNIMFCKLFTFTIFTAQLEDTSKFKVINIFSFLSLLHSGAAIASAIFPISVFETNTQIFYQAIDVIIVTAINVPMAFFNVMKGKTFFYERTIDGFDLKKKNEIEGYNIEDKLEPAGSDQEQQIGFENSFRHQLGTTQTLKFVGRGNWGGNAENEWEQSGESREDLMDKKWEQVSVQAVQILDEEQERKVKLKIEDDEQLQEENQENKEEQKEASGKEEGKKEGKDEDKGEEKQVKKKKQKFVKRENDLNESSKTKVVQEKKQSPKNMMYKPKKKQQKKAKVPFSWADFQKRNKQEGYFKEEVVGNQINEKEQKDKKKDDWSEEKKVQYDDIAENIPGIDSKQIIFEEEEEQIIEMDEPLKQDKKLQQNIPNLQNNQENKVRRESVENQEEKLKLENRIKDNNEELGRMKDRIRQKEEFLKEMQNRKLNKKEKQQIGKLYQMNNSEMQNIPEYIENESSFTNKDENDNVGQKQDIEEDIEHQSIEPEALVFYENGQITQEIIESEQTENQLPLPIFTKSKALEKMKDYQEIKIRPQVAKKVQQQNSDDEKSEPLQQIQQHPLGPFDYMSRPELHNRNTIDTSQFRNRKEVKTEFDQNQVDLPRYNRYAHLINPQQNDRQETEFTHQKPFGKIIMPSGTNAKSHQQFYGSPSNTAKMMPYQSSKDFDQNSDEGNEEIYHPSPNNIDHQNQTLELEQPSEMNSLNNYYMNYFMQRPERTSQRKPSTHRSKEKSKQKNKSNEKSRANFKATEDIYMQRLYK